MKHREDLKRRPGETSKALRGSYLTVCGEQGFADIVLGNYLTERAANAHFRTFAAHIAIRAGCGWRIEQITDG